MVWTWMWLALRNWIAGAGAPPPALRPARIRRDALPPRRAPRRRNLDG